LGNCKESLAGWEVAMLVSLVDWKVAESHWLARKLQALMSLIGWKVATLVSLVDWEIAKSYWLAGKLQC